MDSSQIATAVQVATMVLSVLLPWGSEWLNTQFKINGKSAFVVTAALTVLVAVGALFVTGGLTVSQLTWENFVPVFTLVFTVSQAIFQLVKDRLGWSVER